MSALQWNVPGMKTPRAPMWTTARPMKVAQPGTRRFAAAICMTPEGAPFPRGVLAVRPSRGLRIEFGRQDDLGSAKRSADRAVLLGALGQALELGVVQAGGLDGRAQLDGRDVETLVLAPQVDPGARVDGLGRMALAGEREAQRHREARGVGRGEQLFRVGARVVAEARPERVARRDVAALGGDRSLAAGDVALPVDGRAAYDVGWSLHAPLSPHGVRAVALQPGGPRAAHGGR